jgi:hypothetical protein
VTRDAIVSPVSVFQIGSAADRTTRDILFLVLAGLWGSAGFMPDFALSGVADWVFFSGLAVLSGNGMVWGTVGVFRIGVCAVATVAVSQYFLWRTGGWSDDH